MQEDKTQQEIQARIDEILKKCVIMMANIGTKTPLDVGDVSKAKQLEAQWLKEVEELSPEQYKALVPNPKKD
jgi:aspartate/tyrosine/aromatic aminotransferase